MLKPPKTQITGGVILSLLSAALIIYHAAVSSDEMFSESSKDTLSYESVPEETEVITETFPEPESDSVTEQSSLPQTDTMQPPLPDIESLVSWFSSVSLDPDAPIGDITPEILRTLPETALQELVFISSSVFSPTASDVRKYFYNTTGMTPLAYIEALEKNPDFSLSLSENDDTAIGTLVFAGDFNLGEDFSWCPVNHLSDDTHVSDFLLPPLDNLLHTADVCCINLECTISERGTPTPDKLYTFRGKPENLRYLNELGCDIVSLANNHVHDYGADAMLDTISLLDEADILSIGAGKNLSEAMEYESITVNGVKIGFVAASNAEKFRLTPSADENAPGILTMYDPANIYTAIESAALACDYIVCVVHWGTENSTVVNDNQRELTTEFIRRGADAVIGHHPHVLQETQIIDGVPVVYSLGNFWFNTSPNETAVAEIQLSWNDHEIVSNLIMHPCIHENGITYLSEQPNN